MPIYQLCNTSECCSPSWLLHHSVSSPLTLQGQWPSIQSTSSLSTSLYQSSPHGKRSFTVNTSSLCAPLSCPHAHRGKSSTHSVLAVLAAKGSNRQADSTSLMREDDSVFYFTKKTEIISMVSLTIPLETSTPAWPWSCVHSLLLSFWHPRGKCHPFTWLWITSHPPLQET